MSEDKYIFPHAGEHIAWKHLKKWSNSQEFPEHPLDMTDFDLKKLLLSNFLKVSSKTNYFGISISAIPNI